MEQEPSGHLNIYSSNGAKGADGAGCLTHLPVTLLPAFTLRWVCVNYVVSLSVLLLRMIFSITAVVSWIQCTVTTAGPTAC